MADYATAHGRTDVREGGYANNLDDRGGETYRGVSRRWHPKEDIWAIIDSYKGMPGFPGTLDSDPKLPGLVDDFYEREFWDRIHGDEISSQVIADELFDTAVMMDVPDAVAILQRSLNALNKVQALYPNIRVDGRMGPETLDTIEACLGTKKGEELLDVTMNGLQLYHFIMEMEGDEGQEIFGRGWILNRIMLGRS